MRILAIETSCDDTGIAILEIRNSKSEIRNFNVLSNVVASQIKVHKKYGGVYPALAKREHQRNLLPTLKTSLMQAGFLIQNSKRTLRGASATKNQNYNSKFKIVEKILEREPELEKKLIPFFKKYEKPDIDAIAVANGPGLEPCLWVGVNFAKALSYFWNIPIVPVNHIEAHILVNLLSNKKIEFPAIALVVSGGHTQLILMNNFGKYKIIGETRDDAAGECFDKCAKILGLGYPGGPIISKLAENAKLSAKLSRTSPGYVRLNQKLPRPMINSKDYDFSFSGLKTAVLYAWQKQPASAKNGFGVARMAAEVQQAIIDVLIKKTIKAAKDYKAKTIILGGGVSANSELRKQFAEKIKKEIPNTKYLIPNTQLSTDNGLMVTIAGYFKWSRWQNHRGSSMKSGQDLEANANLRVK